MTAGGSCIFLCICHAETPLFFIAENQSKYFWCSSYTKMLTLLKLALRGGCLTSFYATLRTGQEGLLPLLSADSSHSPRKQGKPCTPKIAPFRLPSSVTLFLGRSGPRKSVPQTNFFPQSLHAQRCVFARVLPLFLMSIDPHAGQQSGVVFVVLAWCWACDGRSPRCPCSQRW